MKSFKEFSNTPITNEIVEANIQESFRQTTAPKLVAEYLKKVKSEEVYKKGFVRYDIEDGFFIKFSTVGNDDGLIGYRVDIESRRISLGQGDILFYDWQTIYSRYYNILTKKIDKGFDKAFR